MHKDSLVLFLKLTRMRQAFCRHVGLGLWLMFVCWGVGAAEPIAIQDAHRLALGHRLSYLEDKSGKLGLEQILQADKTGKFIASTEENPNFGFSHSTYWLRLALTNKAATSMTRLLEFQYPLLDHVTLYHMTADGRLLREQQGGDALPFDVRPFKTRTINFLLEFAPRASDVVFIRIQTVSSVQLPLLLWDLDSFRARDHDERILLGFYYGTITAMWVFSLVVLISTRDRSYFFYCCYLIPFFLFQFTLNGLSFEYLWPDLPYWGNIATPFFIGITAAAALQFNRSYLDLKNNSPNFNRAYLIVISAGLLSSLAVFFVSYSVIIRIGTVIGMLAGALVFSSSIWCLVRKVRQAPYIVLAWAFFMMGVMVYSLKTFKLLPNIFATEYGMQIGSSLEVILLAFALVHRLQREATSLLEQRVEARTQELNHTLAELAHANAALKQISMLDGLTQVKNRKFFDEQFEREMRRAHRESKPLTLILFDIDHFKHINDNYGHPAGDECLRQICRTVEGILKRPCDYLARLGGEEFAILLPDTAAGCGLYIAETVRQAVAERSVNYQNDAIGLTVSLGIATIQNKVGMSAEDFLVQADQALYRAKHEGRNRVCVYAESPMLTPSESSAGAMRARGIKKLVAE